MLNICMLNGMDHIVLACEDINTAIIDYQALIGRSPAWRSENTADGTATALFQMENTALELLSPHGDGPVAMRLRQLLGANGEGLQSLVFRTAEINEAHRVFSRRGLRASEVMDGASTDLETGHERRWKRMRLDTDKTAKVRQFVVENDPETELSVKIGDASQVCALDHVVINTDHPERAIALYGARLGLRFALDRVREDLSTHFMFFKAGDLTLELIARLGVSESSDDGDKMWGLSWLVGDIEAAHERLSKEGFNISEIRPGRKSGTRVFTVRDRTCNTPTIFLEQTPKEAF